MKKELLQEVEKHFRPEFLNRLDEIIVFENLTREDLKHIVEIELGHVETRLKQQGLEVVVTEEVREYLIEQGYNPDFGARPLRRAVEQHIEDPLAEEILRGVFAGKGRIAIELRDGQPFFQGVELLDDAEADAEAVGAASKDEPDG